MSSQSVGEDEKVSIAQLVNYVSTGTHNKGRKGIQMSKITIGSHRRYCSAGSMTITLVVVFVMSAVFTGIACERANSFEKKDANPPLEARPTHAGRSDEINIELTDSGFVPTEIIHSAGAFGIAVENKSSANEYKLQLKAEDGSILKEIPVQKGSVAWSVNLQPGQYRLTEANHEQWVCVIIVQ